MRTYERAYLLTYLVAYLPYAYIYIHIYGGFQKAGALFVFGVHIRAPEFWKTPLYRYPSSATSPLTHLGRQGRGASCRLPGATCEPRPCKVSAKALLRVSTTASVA